MAKPKITILWFKRDLRLADHAPLQAALKAAKAAQTAILPLYIVEPEYWQLKTSSQRHWSFIHDSLIDLRHALTSKGQTICVRTGSAVEVFQQLHHEFEIHGVFAHEETGHLWSFQRDIDLISFFKAEQIAFHEYHNGGVVRRLKSRDDWIKHRRARMEEPILPVPDEWPAAIDIDPGQLPEKDDPIFINVINGQTQKGGRQSGLRIVDDFVSNRAGDYLRSISSPQWGPRFSSRLSPHLAWGTLSEREVMRSLYLGARHAEPGSFARRGINAVLTRLSWRSHFMQKLEDQPDLEIRPMHAFYEGLRQEDENTSLRLKAWEQGMTGFPIIDACMRYLTRTGWLPFRMRAMLVSFASYHLWLDWTVTAPHMARLFTDYEPGIHYSQFQMQSGVTGINTMRVYNPVKQSHDHDADGKFIRSNVPELRSLPTEWLHEPHTMPPLVATELGFVLGRDYPAPIVDNTQAMRSAKDRMTQVKKLSGFDDAAAAVFNKLGSRNRPSTQRKSPQRKSPQRTSPQRTSKGKAAKTPPAQNIQGDLFS